MKQEKVEEVLFDISKTLSKIEEKLSGVCEVLAQHEHRITTLETNKTSSTNDSWKNQLLMLLAKSLIIGLTALCTICGGSSILSQILQSNNSPSISEIQQK